MTTILETLSSPQYGLNRGMLAGINKDLTDGKPLDEILLALPGWTPDRVATFKETHPNLVNQSNAAASTPSAQGGQRPQTIQQQINNWITETAKNHRPPLGEVELANKLGFDSVAKLYEAIKNTIDKAPANRKEVALTNILTNLTTIASDDQASARFQQLITTGDYASTILRALSHSAETGRRAGQIIDTLLSDKELTNEVINDLVSKDPAKIRNGEKMRNQIGSSGRGNSIDRTVTLIRTGKYTEEQCNSMIKFASGFEMSEQDFKDLPNDAFDEISEAMGKDVADAKSRKDAAFVEDFIKTQTANRDTAKNYGFTHFVEKFDSLIKYANEALNTINANNASAQGQQATDTPVPVPGSPPSANRNTAIDGTINKIRQSEAARKAEQEERLEAERQADAKLDKEIADKLEAAKKDFNKLQEQIKLLKAEDAKQLAQVSGNIQDLLNHIESLRAKVGELPVDMQDKVLKIINTAQKQLDNALESLKSAGLSKDERADLQNKVSDSIKNLKTMAEGLPEGIREDMQEIIQNVETQLPKELANLDSALRTNSRNVESAELLNQAAVNIEASQKYIDRLSKMAEGLPEDMRESMQKIIQNAKKQFVKELDELNSALGSLTNPINIKVQQNKSEIEEAQEAVSGIAAKKILKTLSEPQTLSDFLAKFYAPPLENRGLNGYIRDFENIIELANHSREGGKDFEKLAKELDPVIEKFCNDYLDSIKQGKTKLNWAPMDSLLQGLKGEELKNEELKNNSPKLYTFMLDNIQKKISELPIEDRALLLDGDKLPKDLAEYTRVSIKIESSSAEELASLLASDKPGAKPLPEKLKENIKEQLKNQITALSADALASLLAEGNLPDDLKIAAMEKVRGDMGSLTMAGLVSLLFEVKLPKELADAAEEKLVSMISSASETELAEITTANMSQTIKDAIDARRKEIADQAQTLG